MNARTSMTSYDETAAGTDRIIAGGSSATHCLSKIKKCLVK